MQKGLADLLRIAYTSFGKTFNSTVCEIMFSTQQKTHIVTPLNWDILFLPFFRRFSIFSRRFILAAFIFLQTLSPVSIIYAANEYPKEEGIDVQKSFIHGNDPDQIHERIREYIREERYNDALQLLTPDLLDPSKYPKIYSDYLAILIWAGRKHEAIRLFEALPESFLRRPYLLLNMAKAYYDDNQYLTAASLYGAVLNSAPSDEEAQKGLIKSQLMAGRFENALDNVNRLLNTSPMSLPLIRLKSDIFVAQGRYLDAMRLLKKDVLRVSAPEEFKKQTMNSVRSRLQKGDFTAGMNHILLLVLTEDYKDAVKALETSEMAPNHIPRYGLNDIAEAYFKPGQTQKARHLFSAILNIYPDHVRANTGLAYYYLQANEDQNAMPLLNKLVAISPNDIGIRFARAFALNKAQRYWAAIQEYDHILSLLPEDLITRELQLLSLSKMGVSSYALERTIEELPERNALREEFIGDMAVNYLHWDEPDTAIVFLQPLAEVPENLEARFDYIVSLVQDKYYKKAIDAYEGLLKEGVSSPWWLDEWIAEAYLNLKQPKTALVLYNQALAGQPNSFESRIGKFYALQELRQWEEARTLLHEIDHDTPEARILPSFQGKRRSMVPNWPKLEVALARGWFELYQDRLKEGQTIFEALYENAPSDIGIRKALAHANLWRGWPRKALQGFNIIDSMAPETEYQHQLGRIGTLNQLGFKEEARKETAALASQHPRDRHVQELVRELRVEDMHEFTTDMLVEDEKDSQTFQLQINMSKLVSPRTRLYGLTLWQDIKDDDRSGKYRRGGLGVDHTFNDIFSLNQQISADYEGMDEFGSLTHIGINPNDYLFLDATYDSFSTDVPALARLAGIDAQKISTGVLYRESDWREYHLSLSRQLFSDNNNRDQILLGYEQGLYVKDDWMMRLFIDASHSRNSIDTAPYFNPKRDWTVSATHMTQRTVWRIYDRAFVHRLYITVGDYKQCGFSDEWVGSVRYEQEHTFSDTCALIGDLSLERNVYDGDPEDSLTIHLAYRWRF